MGNQLDNFDRLNATIERFQVNMQALPNAMNSVNTAITRLSGNSVKAEKSFKSMGLSLRTMMTQAAVNATFGALTNGVNGVLDAYMQLESATLGLQSQVMAQGRSFSTATTWLNGYVSDGLIPMAEATMAYKNLLARGYETKDIQETLDLFKDAAVFNRQANMSVGKAVASATEGVRNENSLLTDNIGITKNVAKMWRDYAKSIGTTADKLTRQQKIQAEISKEYGFQADAKLFQNNSEKAAQTLGGKLSALGASFFDLKAAIGSVAAPLMMAFLPSLINGIKVLSTFMNYLGAVTAKLFGFSKAQFKMGDFGNKAADGQNSLADGIDAAGKAAASNLQGFDELNTLQKDSGGSGTPSITAPEIDNSSLMDNILNPFAKMFDNMKKLFQPIMTSIDGLVKAFMPLKENIGIGLKWFLDNVLVPLSLWTITELIPSFINLLAGALTFLNGVLVVVAPMLGWLWDNFLQPIAVWTGGLVITGIDLLTGALTNLGTWIAANKELVQGFFTSILILVGISQVGTAIWGVYNAIFAVVGGIAKFAGLLTPLFSAIGGIIAAIGWPITLTILAVAALAGAFVYLWQTNQPFQNFIKDMWQGIQDFFVSLWKDTLVPFGLFLGSLFMSAWTALKTAIGIFYTSVLVPVGNFLKDLYNNLLVPMGKFLGGLFYIVWQGISSIVKSFTNDVLKPLANLITSNLNPAWEALKAVMLFLWNFVFVPLGTYIKDLFIGTFNDLVGVITSLWNNITKFLTPAFQAMGIMINWLWNNVTKPFATFLKDVLVLTVTTAFKTIGEGINSVSKIITGLLNFITGVFTGDWRKAWEGVVTVFSGIIGGIVGVFKTPLNGIIDLLNNFIRKVNTIKISIPSVDIPGIGTVGGGSIGFNIPEVPRLANGGITNGASIAMVGEGKYNEAITPLGGPQYDRFVEGVANAVVSAMSVLNSSSNGNGNKDIIINVDGQNLARVAYPYFESEGRRSSNSIIVAT